MKLAHSLAAASALLAAPALAQNALPQKLDIDTAVALALAHTPGLGAVRARQEAASDQAKSLRGRLLPTIVVNDEQQHYDGPFNIAFGPASFTARNINTNVFTVAANEPLLGLLHLTQDHAALSNVAEAAEAQTRAVEATVREQVESGYLRMFEALAEVKIAKSSEAQLAEQHNLAAARLRAGVITNADVLRIETAQANAKLEEVQAQAQADATQTALLVTLGYPNDAQGIEFVEPTEKVEAVPETSADVEVQQRAEANRPEVAAAKLQMNAAGHQKTSSLFKLLPEIDLEGAYTHIHGEILAPEDSAFVGLKGSWPIFTWGADWYAYRAASANAEAAALSAEDQARNVRIDASGKLTRLRASRSAVDLANAAIASATEAYRVTDAQVKAGVATSTSDLLDAQSALTQAELNLTRAKYERAIAAVALKRATGG